MAFSHKVVLEEVRSLHTKTYMYALSGGRLDNLIFLKL